MELLVLPALILLGAYILKSRDQRQRIALLGSHLGQYQIEKLMETLTEGYLRCLGEADAERRAQIWNMLSLTEATLTEQFNRFAADFAKVDEAQTRVSKFPLAIPFIHYASRIFPGTSFDVRKVFLVHARGIADAAANRRELSPRDKAFTMSAELFLMQHTCHWYCRSKAVASTRMMARHQNSYALLLDSVAPDTRIAYRHLTGD